MASLGRQLVGGFFLVMGGVHLGIVATDPQQYENFADHGLFPFVRDGWADIVMANPAFWGLLLMAGEITAGTLLLAGGRAARVGWWAVIVFHVLLMLFGWWVWAWSVPVLVLLVWLRRLDLREAS
ncbi:putative integral membrane protein [metagenome]|uniref:Putative integral membrane protein n=1 Tax=metagenome TaxID=256318 RepID=A0A2P2C5G3_9ZZZZ